MRNAGSTVRTSTERPNAASLTPREGARSASPRTIEPRLSDEHQVLERTPDYVISSWRRVMLLAWRGVETAEGILRSRSLMERWPAPPDGGVVLVILMPRSAPNRPPNDETRAAMARVSQNAGPEFRGVGIITHHGGFIGAAIRSVMTARQLLVRDPIPFKMFATAEEAAPWVLQQTGLSKLLAAEFASVVGNAQ